MSGAAQISGRSVRSNCSSVWFSIECFAAAPTNLIASPTAVGFARPSVEQVLGWIEDTAWALCRAPWWFVPRAARARLSARLGPRRRPPPAPPLSRLGPVWSCMICVRICVGSGRVGFHICQAKLTSCGLDGPVGNPRGRRPAGPHPRPAHPTALRAGLKAHTATHTRSHDIIP